MTPTRCFHVSDLHGSEPRYAALFDAIESEVPAAVFLGGDLLPTGLKSSMRSADGFLSGVLAPGFRRIGERLGDRRPRVFLILGNDDPRAVEPSVLRFESEGLWTYAHGRSSSLGDYPVYGYSYVPPTPFLMKDWERYDVSHFVDPGSVSPEDGWSSVPTPSNDVRWGTIQDDLEQLTGREDLTRAIFLFHTPPYRTDLDRAGLDGRVVDHVPLDVHVGSIAVRRFIEARQPLVTLHGHVHESARLTGQWKAKIGRSVLLDAAHDGPELALVRFALEDPWSATRELVVV